MKSTYNLTPPQAAGYSGNKFIMHIMWYEHRMLPETFDSILHAIDTYKQIKPEFLDDWEFIFCLNAQTYIERPDTGKYIDDMIDSILSHSIFSQIQNMKIIHKTNQDAFYNIGDFRREYHQNPFGYITWGESDCLLPMDFFYVLDGVKQSIIEPHLLSFSSRKMWDITWNEVEYELIRDVNEANIKFPMHCGHYGTQEQLDEINDYNDNAKIIKLKKHKVDGSLLSLYKIDKEMIPENLHFVREDACLQCAATLYKIPQYHVSNRLKFHNYSHPLKRTDTESKRSDDIFKQYEKESIRAMNLFVKKLGGELQ